MRKRSFLSAILLILVFAFTSCISQSTYIKRIENINGQTYIVLNEKNKPSGSMGKNNVRMEYTRISSGSYAVNISYDRTLIVKPFDEEYNSIILRDGSYGYNKTVIFEEQIERDIVHYKLSPDRNKLMFVFKGRVSVMDLNNRNNPNPFVGIKKNAIESSVVWKDDETILYSCTDGSIYEKNVYNGSEKRYELDSIHKYNLSVIDNKIVYLKTPESNVSHLSKNHRLFQFYADYSKKNGNSLNYIDGDYYRLILDWLGSYNIKKYSVSPNGKNIALYFEDANNNSKLFIGTIKEGIVDSNIAKRGFIHISNESVDHMVWSQNSRRLAYSVSKGDKGLFVVNEDGSENNKILDDITIYDIDWSKRGDQLLVIYNDFNSKSVMRVFVNRASK
ncbi:MAG: hypothetical protein ACOZCL_03035 [Bacillota bacterium]